MTCAAGSPTAPSAAASACAVEAWGSLLRFDEPAAETWLRAAYRVHQRVLCAWPDGEAGRVLFAASPRRGELLVRSATPPDWARALAGWYLHPEVTVRPERVELVAGQVWRFGLLANPAKRDGETGKRVGADPAKWIRRKLTEAGAEPLGGALRWVRTDWARRGDPLTVTVARFTGYLRVVEPDQLAAAWRDGIGPAKGFGCGLLRLLGVDDDGA